MDDKIIEFYESRQQHIHKLLERRPHKINSDKIMLAISDIYDQIQKGRVIPDIRLAREVWRQAYNYSNREMNRRLVFLRATEEAVNKYLKMLKLGIGACGIVLIILIALIIVTLK
jgi:hypothetical protein